MSAQNTRGTGSTPSPGGTGTNSGGGTSSMDQMSAPARRRARQFSAGAAIGIGVVLLAVGIGGGYVLGAYLTKTSAATIDITEAGSTLLEPMVQIWSPAYHNDVNSHVTVSPGGGGSGEGQSESEAGDVDIGASDAYTASNVGVVDVPVAISSQMVLYYLPGLSSKVHLNLNGTVLAMIYEGTISNWDNWMIQEANPGVTLPNEQILPVVRSDSSGDTYIFSTYCDMSYKSWAYGNSTTAFQKLAPASGFDSGDGNTGVIAKLNETEYSIGYVGISYKTIALASGHLNYAALGDNLANTAAGGNVTKTPADAKNYIWWSPTNVSYDASLGLNQLNYATDGLALSLILGGSPAGATTWKVGGGGSNPTVADPSPYPITNLEYFLIKTSPSSPSHQTYVVQFVQWCISYGNALSYLDKVNFIGLTPQIQGLDQQALSSVTISS